MKIAFLSFCLFATSLVSCQEETDMPETAVPSLVRNALGVQYQHAQNLEWEQKDDLYEAEFDLNLIEHSALIDASGRLLMLKKDVPLNNLPAAVVTAAQKVNPDQPIEDAELVQKGSEAYYQVEFDGALSDTNLVYTPDGQEASGVAYWD